MHLFGGSSRQDREHVYATLRSLGPTSVDGLSAALSWSSRRTERTIRAALRSGDGVALRFDSETRSIALAGALPSVPGIGAAAAVAVPATAPAPTLPKAWDASPKCPACQVALISTGTGTSVYCPECGKLSGTRANATQPIAPATVSSPSAPSPPRPAPNPSPRPTLSPTAASGPAVDRREQEMFAAWVTARPIPCPKCRTPLRHRGVASYGCPACGAQIAFDRSTARSASGVSGSPSVSALSGPSGPGPTL